VFSAANPDRDCIVFGDRRFTFAQTDERGRRFARALHSRGLGAHRAMLGAYQARVAPFSVNYRYVADEPVYLLR
jgi:3-oxocholest-4-en-26-oate---CoA ligase